MAWLALAGGVLKSFGASSAAKKDAKTRGVAAEYARGTADRAAIEFKNASDYYYQQLGKQEKMRGLDEFRKFSTVTNFAPTYVNTNTGPQVPVMPNYNDPQYASITPKKP
jgi:hypothetical protein